MEKVATIGLDIAKSVFQVHGVDEAGGVVVRRRLTRSRMLPFFAKLPRCLVGIEACNNSHHWARELTALGHDVKLMPAQYVRLYLKAENPNGRRIDRLFAGIDEVSPERLYKVAFVTEQGVPTKFGTRRAKTGVLAIEALRRLFAKAPITKREPIQTVFVV